MMLINNYNSRNLFHDIMLRDGRKSLININVKNQA